MSTLGYIESGNILSYLDCLKQFFFANDLDQGQQTEIKCKAILLSTIGEKMYRVLENLYTPQNLSDRTFEEIKHLLLEHFKHKYLVIVESHWFYKAKQEEGESVSNFFVWLKHLLSMCEFGIFLEETLWDKFVCALDNKNIQKKTVS